MRRTSIRLSSSDAFAGGGIVALDFTVLCPQHYTATQIIESKRRKTGDSLWVHREFPLRKPEPGQYYHS